VLIDDSGPPRLAQRNLELFGNVAAKIFQQRTGLFRVWILGDDLESTRVIYSEHFEGPAEAGLPAKRAYEDQLAHELPKYLSRVAQEHLGKVPHKKSPIASGITKIALTAAPEGFDRAIAIASDLLEEDTFQFECGPLPTPDIFVQTLHERGLLRPDALRGIRLVFGYFEVAPELQGCRQDAKRFTQIVTLWEAAARAGEARVVLRAGELTVTNFELKRRNEQ
jgi:hypothetical protein